MADTKGSALGTKATPIGADSILGIDSTGPTNVRFTMQSIHQIYTNNSSSQQGAGFSSDTYLSGSNIPIPSGAPYAGSTYEAYFDVTKTAAGTATPIIAVRIGTAGTTSDAAICTFTFGAGTAAIDVAQVQIICTFRSVGSGTSAVLQGIAAATTNLTTTGWSASKKAVVVTSSGFDSTTAGLIIGMSYNGGTSASHTIQLVRSKLTL